MVHFLRLGGISEGFKTFLAVLKALEAFWRDFKEISGGIRGFKVHFLRLLVTFQRV